MSAVRFFPAPQKKPAQTERVFSFETTGNPLGLQELLRGVAVDVAVAGVLAEAQDTGKHCVVITAISVAVRADKDRQYI